MLTAEQLDEFRRTGIVRVPGAISPRDAAAMCDAVWETLAHRHKIRRDDPLTWKAQRITGFKDRPASITFEQVADPAISTMLDGLLGPDDAWEPAQNWGNVLVSFPGAYPEAPNGWFVPHQGWHLDAPVVRALPEPYGMRIFLCLAQVAPGGGATLAIAGSPRLALALANARGMAKMRSGDVRKGLVRRYQWMRDLRAPEASKDRVHRFMETSTRLDDVEARVVEMTGDPGDAYLMHPLTMHAASSNCLDTPRIVLSAYVYRRSIDWSMLYSDEAAA